jgi:hypothetical protein
MNRFICQLKDKKAAGFRTAQPLLPGNGVVTLDKKSFFLPDREKAMPVNLVKHLFPEEFFGFLPKKLRQSLPAHTVNYTKNVWFPADF